MREIEERGDLAVVRLDKGMRHRAVHGYAEESCRKHGRGAREAGEVRSARREHAGFGAMRAPQAEVDQQLARRGERATRGLRGDDGFEVQQRDEPGLDQLRLRQRCADPQDRLLGKEHGALGHRVDVPGEAQLRQVLENAVVETRALPQPIEFVAGEMQVFQEFERLLESRRHQEIAHARKLAHVELERGGLRHAAVEIRLQHGELIEVGEQGARARVPTQIWRQDPLRTHTPRSSQCSSSLPLHTYSPTA